MTTFPDKKQAPDDKSYDEFR